MDELEGLVWKGRVSRWARAALPTGFASLDSFLPGGGWPLGGLIEVFVERYGVGELTLLAPALAALTRAGPRNNRKWVAWIAPPFVPYAPALKQRGIDVDALLLVQPAARDKSKRFDAPKRNPAARSKPAAQNNDTLWTVEQVIRSGSSSGVLAWLAAADHIALRRLQLAAEEQGCWTVLFRPLAARRDRSPAALRIGVEQNALTTRVQIDKCRGASPGVVDITASMLALNRKFEDAHAFVRELAVVEPVMAEPVEKAVVNCVSKPRVPAVDAVP